MRNVTRAAVKTSILPATRKREIEIEKGDGPLEGLSPNDLRNH